MAHSKKAWVHFLKCFEKTGNVETSCKASGISVTQAYRKRKANREFREAWKQIKEASRIKTVDEIEAALVRRAKGWEETDRHGIKRERYSDAAAKLWLQAHAREYSADTSAFGGAAIDQNVEAARASYRAKLEARFEKAMLEHLQGRSEKADSLPDQPDRKVEMKRLRQLLKTDNATTEDVNQLYKLSRERTS